MPMRRVTSRARVFWAGAAGKHSSANYGRAKAAARGSDRHMGAALLPTVPRRPPCPVRHARIPVRATDRRVWRGLHAVRPDRLHLPAALAAVATISLFITAFASILLLDSDSQAVGGRDSLGGAGGAGPCRLCARAHRGWRHSRQPRRVHQHPHHAAAAALPKAHLLQHGRVCVGMSCVEVCFGVIVSSSPPLPPRSQSHVSLLDLSG